MNDSDGTKGLPAEGSLQAATLAVFIDSVRDYAIFMLDADGNVATWNEGASVIKGYTAAEIIGKPYSDFFSPSDVEAGRPAGLLERARREGRAEDDGWRVRRDGSRFWANAVLTAVRNEAGTLVGFAKVTRDLTDRRRLEEERARSDAALREAEETFRLAVENAPIGMALVGLGGQWLRVNKALCELFGYSNDELLAKTSQEVTHPDDLAADLALVEQLLRGAIPRYELAKRYLRKDGSVVGAVLHVSLVRDAVGGPRHFIAQIQDVTEMERLHERVMLADRMASVGTLAAGVAHEINNPLAFVISNVEMVGESLTEMAKNAPSPIVHEMQEYIRYAREGSERVRRIVGDLKTFSRAEDHRHEPLDVRAILELATRMTFNEIRHRARLVKDFGDVPIVDGDDARLGQVFVNLLANAARAITEGGVDDNEIRITTRTSPSGEAVVEVQDTGSGIPPSLRARIFDPFFTTKDVGEGMGLGLAISHAIVTEHGGHIDVESPQGRGSLFRVTLPAARAVVVVEPVRDAPPAVANRPRSGRVLVIDDDELVAKSFARVLREHDVKIVTDARLALESLRAGADVDLILCDLMMPDMTGIELFAELSRTDPALAERIVFVTGGAFTPQARAFLETVPNQRLEKPVDNQRLRAMARTFVRGGD